MSVIAASSGAAPVASGVTTRSRQSATGSGRQQNVLLVKGAAECVLSRCSKVGPVHSPEMITGTVPRQGHQLHALQQTGREWGSLMQALGPGGCASRCCCIWFKECMQLHPARPPQSSRAVLAQLCCCYLKEFRLEHH